MSAKKFIFTRSVAPVLQMIEINETTALLVVDVQNDFIPGGALPVKDADKVVYPLNAYIKLFKEKGRPTAFTRDLHPPNHMSFKEKGGTWPRHCVERTHGSEFHPSLSVPEDAIIISKGTDPKKEAYSGFEGTDLSRILKEKGITTLFVGGLATDYCVKSTVLDALKEGFKVYFLSDASTGVNVQPKDSERAVEEMINKGAKNIRLPDVAT